MFSIYHRLGQFFTGLRAAVAARSGPAPSWFAAHHVRVMTVPLIVRVWKQLAWLEPRLDRAIARAAAGKPPRPSRAGAAKSPRFLREGVGGEVAPAPSPPVTPRERIPTREGWLVHRMPHVFAPYGDWLRAVMETPELAPHLAHPSVARLLRPICRMLNVSDALPPRPARPKPVTEPAGRLTEAPSATAIHRTPAQPDIPPQDEPEPRLLRPRRPIIRPPRIPRPA